MMVIVAHLGLAGFFGLVTRWGASHARHPIFLLGVVILISGGLSAVLVNDAICVALTPLVVATAAALELDPVPYLIAVAMAANVGSVATPTGNPQNMLIASTSGAGYLEFAAALTPIAAMGLAATFVLILAFHPRQFLTRRGLARQTRQDRKLVHGSLVLKSLLTAAGVIGALMAGAAPPLAALAGSGLLLLIGRVRPVKVWHRIDWPLLVMFAGLFVVVAGFERSVLTPEILAFVRDLRLENPVRLVATTAVLSNLVSNVPAVLVLRPFIERLPEAPHAWAPCLPPPSRPRTLRRRQRAGRRCPRRLGGFESAEDAAAADQERVGQLRLIFDAWAQESEPQWWEERADPLPPNVAAAATP